MDQAINGFYPQTTIADGDKLPFYDITGNTGQTSCNITYANLKTALLTAPIFTDIATFTGGINIGTGSSSLTIASGSITVTTAMKVIIVDTEGAAASDDLENITPLTEGQIIIIRIANNARAVTLKSTGNIAIGADILLDRTLEQVVLRGGPSKWTVVSSYQG